MYINSNVYMKHYLKYLKSVGVHINGRPNWISNDLYIDGSDYSLISFGDGCTISREVMMLTHDFSMHTVLRELDSVLDEKTIEILFRQDEKDKLRILKGITIGDHAFIGARVTLLPGTIIGKNCIVGAGAVVKGNVPDYSIVIGNPARTVGQVDAWITEKAFQIITDQTEKTK